MNIPFEREIRIRRLDPERKLSVQRAGQFTDRDSFSILASRFPDYLKKDDLIVLRALNGSPVLDEVLELAVELGLTIQQHWGDKAQVIVRDYGNRLASDEEIATGEAFEAEIYKPLIAWGESDEAGVLKILRNLALRNHSKREWGGMANLFHLIALRGETCEAIKSSGLRGLEVLDLDCIGGWPDSSRPLSLIWSNELLMPVDQKLFDDKGNVYESEEIYFNPPDRRYYLIDGNTVNPRLHYRENPLGDLDIALTRERIGGMARCYHKIVYSRRAVSLFQELGIECSWIPVQLG